MGGTMHDSRRYRDSAAECLLAAQEASQSHCRKFHLSMAISWLSLARQYEAIERLFQGTGEAALIKGAHYPILGTLVLKKPLVLNASCRCLLGTLRGKKTCDINKWLNSE